MCTLGRSGVITRVLHFGDNEALIALLALLDPASYSRINKTRPRQWSAEQMKLCYYHRISSSYMTSHIVRATGLDPYNRSHFMLLVLTKSMI